MSCLMCDRENLRRYLWSLGYSVDLPEEEAGVPRMHVSSVAGQFHLFFGEAGSTIPFVEGLELAFENLSRIPRPHASVVVACAETVTDDGQPTVCERLYGNCTLLDGAEDGRVVRVDSAGGLFGPASNNHVGALLSCLPRTMTNEIRLRIFHNPWADCPLPTNLLAALTQLAPVLMRPNVELEWI